MKTLIAVICAFCILLTGCSSSPENSKEWHKPSDVTDKESEHKVITPEVTIAPKTTRFTVAFTGDFLIHSNVWAAAQTGNGFDFGRLLSPPVVKILKQSDLALCHLEVPFAPAGGPYSSYPLFSAPPQLATAIKEAGYDGCSTASNHMVDKGFAGLVRTIDTLKKAGLKHTGTFKSKNADRIAFYAVKGVKVAQLSYSYGTNGMPVEHDWSVNLLNPKQIKADAATARKRGADVVIVGLHWGNEYQVEPSAEQMKLAGTLTKDSNIDFIYGHHAHVVQPTRKVNGKWVSFGLGNFLAGQNGYRPGVNDGVIATVKITVDGDQVRVAKPEYIHTNIGSDMVVRLK